VSKVARALDGGGYYYEASEDLIEARLELGQEAWNAGAGFDPLFPLIRCDDLVENIADFYHPDNAMSLSFLADQPNFEAIEEYWEAVCITTSLASFFVNWVVNDESPAVLFLDKLDLRDGLNDYEERQYGDVTLNQFTYDVEVDVCIDGDYKDDECSCLIFPLCVCSQNLFCEDRIAQFDVHLRESVAFVAKKEDKKDDKKDDKKSGKNRRQLGEEEDTDIVQSHTSLDIVPTVIDIIGLLLSVEGSSVQSADCAVPTEADIEAFKTANGIDAMPFTNSEIIALSEDKCGAGVFSIKDNEAKAAAMVDSHLTEKGMSETTKAAMQALVADFFGTTAA
jgi:hypothetical protein